MTGELEQFDNYFRKHSSISLVEVTASQGSTPREAGTWMLVSESHSLGTIGGGQLEYMAIDQARKMLRSGKHNEQMDIPLGPEIGQCCGGRVILNLSRVSETLCTQLRQRLVAEFEQKPQVFVFGAGHVGHALMSALMLLPVQAILVDQRQNELLNAPPGAETKLTVMPEELVRQAPTNSAFVILTHDHALDFLIAHEALLRDDAAYVGMIGSKTKRATFKSWLRQIDEGSGLQKTGFEQLTCPIGGAHLGDKRPAVIAAQVAAEIMRAFNSVDSENDVIALEGQFNG